MTEMHRAKRLLAEAIHSDLAGVPDEATIANFAPWDSLAHLRLVLALERAIGRELDPDEAIRIENLEDIASLLNELKKGSDPAGLTP
jgi:acyl carrier protein